MAWMRRTTSISSPTTMGAKPRDISSIHNTFGIEQERLRDRDLLLLTAGKGARLLPPAGGQRRKGLVDDLATFLMCDLPSPAVRACISRFSSTVMSVNTDRPPTTISSPWAGKPLGGHARDLVAEVGHRAPCRLLQSRDHLEERGLAGTVGAEQGQRLPLVNLERYPEEHLKLPVGEVEVRDSDAAARPPGRSFEWRIPRRVRNVPALT